MGGIRGARGVLAALAILAVAAISGPAATAAGSKDANLNARLDRLEANITYAEDLQAIKRLQRAYGYYLDKGMWTDLAELFADDAVANYPAGVYIGKKSIREHLYRNVGAVKMGEVGLGDNRIYNHMNIQPVVNVDPGGKTAKGRWRAFAFFGSPGRIAVWAEGIYEIGYVKDKGVWKIKTLDYYSGFGAPYEGGWKAPDPKPAGAPAQPRRPRNLPYPPDKPRNEACPGFPEACIAPFHYKNPGTSEDGHAWRISDADIAAAKGKDSQKRADALAQRAMRLKAETDVENLQRIYGFYYSRGMWDQMADLFADNGTIEMAQRGVYVGKDHVRAFLKTLAPEGLANGMLNDHLQLQTLVTVSADGKTARARSREMSMTGKVGGKAMFEEGVYENRYVNDDGIWKIQSVHYYPTVITDWAKGWAKDAEPAPGMSKTLPPDRPPSEVYAIYPKAQIPAYHYRNPVTGKEATYPSGGRPGAPSKAARKANLMVMAKARPMKHASIEAALSEAEGDVAAYKSYNEIENLESAYGYYLDKDLWNNLADLFSKDSSMELAQRGIYTGQDHIRAFLLQVFGRGKEGPVKNRLGNHIQLQPVISISPDGKSAKVRVAMLQQMAFGQRASIGGAVYENEAVIEDGVWKLSKLHAYNTYGAPYDGGWVKDTGKAYVPGPSKDMPPDAPPSYKFDMFPAVYFIPFHYANPVTGRTFEPTIANKGASMGDAPTGGTEAGQMEVMGIPPKIARVLREIGPRIEGAKTTALYAPLLEKEPYKGVTVSRNLKYGPHERHVLDVFSTPKPGSGKPVVVFVHGGGFSRGAKQLPGTPFYDNVGVWAAHNGFVGVTINYRLAPEFKYPSGVQDLTRVVAWLKEHAAQYGGDPDKIVLWGHSAGAAHVGDYVAAKEREDKDAGIAGAIVTSGFYTFGDTVSIWKSYYGDDVSKYKDMASLPWLLKSDVPLMVNDAELDPPTFKPDTVALVSERAAEGKPVYYVHLHGHSHLSETYAVGTGDETLARPVLDFVHSVTGG